MKQITELEVRGIKMKLWTHNRSLELCARMNYETENLDFIDSLPEHSIYYDLGACEGRFAIYAALKGKQVFAFEPENDNFEVLKSNVEINSIKDEQIKIFKVGVGETEKTSILNIGQPWAGGHQKIVEHPKTRNDLNFDFKTQQKVSIVALDSFIETNYLPKPDYLKVDVDGSEMPFIHGANKTISKIKKMIFELNKHDEDYETIIEFLKKSGLEIEQEFQVPNEPNLYNIVFINA